MRSSPSIASSSLFRGHLASFPALFFPPLSHLPPCVPPSLSFFSLCTLFSSAYFTKPIPFDSLLSYLSQLLAMHPRQTRGQTRGNPPPSRSPSRSSQSSGSSHRSTSTGRQSLSPFFTPSICEQFVRAAEKAYDLHKYPAFYNSESASSVLVIVARHITQALNDLLDILSNHLPGFNVEGFRNTEVTVCFKVHRELVQRLWVIYHHITGFEGPDRLDRDTVQRFRLDTVRELRGFYTELRQWLYSIECHGHHWWN